MRSARARRRDANEPEIVQAFEAHGCSVTRLDGNGVPDLLVGHSGTTWLVEVKKPLGPKGGLTSTRYEHLGGRGDFTADQVKWWESWSGETPVVVRSVADVEALLLLGKEWSVITVDEIQQALVDGSDEGAAARRLQKRSPRR